jgi:DNA processing protein
MAKRAVIKPLRLTNPVAAKSPPGAPPFVNVMARGIDAIGHHGALASNGHAIGVLGTGIDVCYPKENKKLYEKVLERGAILQRVPAWNAPGTREFPHQEPHCRRNATCGYCD